MWKQINDSLLRVAAGVLLSSVVAAMVLPSYIETAVQAGITRQNNIQAETTFVCHQVKEKE